jgi:hypothetical protein
MYRHVKQEWKLYLHKKRVLLIFGPIEIFQSNKVILDSKEFINQSACGIPVRTVRRTYAQELRLSKKDKTPIVDDYDDSTDIYEISTQVICSEIEKDEWPC